MNQEKMTLMLYKAFRKGLKVFSYHIPTGKLKEQEYEVTRRNKDMEIEGFTSNIEKDCIYVLALNQQNAIKKLKKIANAVKNI